MIFTSTTRFYNTRKRQLVCQLRMHTAALGALMLAVTMITLSDRSFADIGATHTSLVSEFASFNTPGVVDGRVEAIAVDGDRVYVGGTFTQIQNPLSDEIINQPYLFAYSKSSGDIIRSFDPVLNNRVLALETTGDGSGIFAGGAFSSINGEFGRRGLVKIDNNGDRVSGFTARPNALVKTLVRLEDTLYAGGNFSRISGTQVEHVAAIDTSTGAVNPNLNLDFEGRLFTADAPNTVQGIDDMDITSDGRLMAIIGNFQSIDNISRTRIAVIELDGQARVSTWNTDVYDIQCPVERLPQYIRGIDISPDDSYMMIASQGGRRRVLPGCDSLVRMDLDDLSDTDVQPTWVNYTGGDSVYDVVSTGHAVYMGGHFEFVSNNLGVGNRAGPGGQARRGLAALDPLNGLTLLDWRSDRNPRGFGVFTMIAEPEGLYFGDDTDFLNGTEHKKLKFMPITEDAIARPNAPTLPTTLITNRGLGVVGLTGSAFDGNSIGNPIELSATEFGQSTAAMFVGGQLFYTNTSGQMRVKRVNGDLIGAFSYPNLYGLTENEWPLSLLGGMFFDYELSRIYYSVQGDPQLYYRGFTPDGSFFGSDVGVADQPGDILWADVRSMDVVDGHLYFTRTNGNLYRADVDGADIISGTTLLISGPQIDGRSWDNTILAFLSEGAVIDTGDTNDAEYVFESSGNSQGVGRFRQFEFQVSADEPVVLRLDWLDPAANLRLFVRDSNNVRIAADTSRAGSPRFLRLPPGDGGTYTAVVIVSENSTAYTLKVNPAEPPPEPRADYDFRSSGTGQSGIGRFQTFSFDVAAGEVVDARLDWDDQNAELRLFLRDETGAQFARDIDGTGSAAVSIIARSSGRWTAAVVVRDAAATVNYDLLIDTD